MPTRNSILKFHGRYSILTKKLWRKYVKEVGDSSVSYKEFRAIILLTIDEARKWILREPVGFRFPYKIGNIAINTFKTYGDFKTYTNTRTADGKPIKNHNLHTGGNTYRLQWFHATRQYTERIPFWYFVASRDFKRSLAKVLKGGTAPVYNTYMQDQFISKRKK